MTSLQNLEQASVLVQRDILSCWLPMNVFIPLRAVSSSFTSALNASNSSFMAAETLAEVLSDRGVVSLGVSCESDEGLGPLLLGVEPLENGEGSLPNLAKGGLGSLAGLPKGRAGSTASLLTGGGGSLASWLRGGVGTLVKAEKG